MQENLPKLLALQELDLQIRDLEKKKAFLDKVLLEEKALHSTHLEDFEKEKSKLTKLQTEIKELEIELEVLQEKRKKLEAQQAAVKTNQEYKALNKEILDTCAEIDRTEEVMIKKLDEIDEEKERLKKLGGELDVEKEKLDKDVMEVENDIRKVEAEIAELNKKRDEIIPTVDASTVRIYQKIFNRTGGPAIVAINNRTCAGCHLSVTAQVENMARRNEELVLCENCSRILFHKDEDEEGQSEEDS